MNVFIDLKHYEYRHGSHKVLTLLASVSPWHCYKDLTHIYKHIQPNIHDWFLPDM